MEHLDLGHRSIDELEQIITTCESSITRLRALQMAAIGRLDELQAPLSDGCRSLGEWVTGRLDIAPETAKTLVAAAKRLQSLPTVEQAATDGALSFDRVAAVARLAESSSGDEAAVLAQSAGIDVAGIHRRASQQQRLNHRDEQHRFGDRYCATQFNLDHTGLRFHGEIYGIAARRVAAALHTVGDQLPDTAGSRATRNADALWKMCQDALDTTTTTSSSDDDAPATSPQVTIFIDATQAAATGAETGMVIAAGPRVGPNTLEAIVCDSILEVTAHTEDGTPINLGRRSRSVSPQLRRFVLHRDGESCTADGCNQPLPAPSPPHRSLEPRRGHRRRLPTTSSSTATATTSTPTPPPQRRRFIPPAPTTHPDAPTPGNGTPTPPNPLPNNHTECGSERTARPDIALQVGRSVRSNCSAVHRATWGTLIDN